MFDIESVDEFRARMESEIERLRLALVANDPERLPALFPQFVPSSPMTDQALDRGLATGAPLTVDTVLSPDEALDWLKDNKLTLDDIDLGQDI